MKLTFSLVSMISIVLFGSSCKEGIDAFSPSKLINIHKGTRTRTPVSRFETVSTGLYATSDDEKAKRMQEILQEEASNSNSMKAAAEQMKNLKPEDMDKMLQEMDNMNPLQKQVCTTQ